MAAPGQGLGFATAGYAIAVISDPDGFPDAWNPRVVDIAPSTFDAVPATAVIQDGAYIVAVAIRQEGTHAGALVRYPTGPLAEGVVDDAEWWADDGRGWVPESSLGAGGPAFVLNDAGSECSLHWDERMGSFIHIASYGFGASTIGLRTAPALTGPWSSPVVVYRPPESGWSGSIRVRGEGSPGAGRSRRRRPRRHVRHEQFQVRRSLYATRRTFFILAAIRCCAGRQVRRALCGSS